MQKKVSIKTILFVVLFVILLASLISVFMHFLNRFSAKKTLFSAIRNNDCLMVEAIINKYPSLINENEFTLGFVANVFDTSSQTPLLIACQYENEEIIKFLVENGADINKSSNNVDGYPLLSVIECGNYELGWYFIKNGADLSVQQPRANLPFAIVNSPIKTDDIENQRMRLELMKYAIENGVSLTPPNQSLYGMQSVYGMAARHNNCAIVEYLLSEGIFLINERVDDMNRTALMVAAQGKAYGVFELLLQLEADTKLVDQNGKNVYDYLMESNDEKLLFLYKNHTAEM